MTLDNMTQRTGESHMKNEICIKMQCKLKKIQYYNVHKSELAKTTDVIFNINQLKDRIKNYIYRIVTDTG